MLMKIAVIGVGAVGCYYGGMLARAVLAAQMIGAGHSRNGGYGMEKFAQRFQYRPLAEDIRYWQQSG